MTAANIGLIMPDKINGVILFAPAVQEPRRVGKIPGRLITCGKGFGRVLNFCYKGTPLTKTDPKGSCKNVNFVKYKLQDEYYYMGRSRTNSIISVLDSLAALRGKLKDFRVPVLVIQGGKDKKVDPIGAFWLME